MRVRITRLPKARTGYQVQGALVNDVPAMGGKDYNAYIGAPDMKVNRSLTAVPREDANLEAEGGETVMGNIDGSNIPSFYTIQGPRHASGGVPLNLPDDSFIFSDTKSMKMTDPTLLKMFNLSNKKGGYTPAEMSKKYDINKYRQILQDPDTDKIARKTAEIMIKNAVMKLGALALAQESKKGFPQGIPAIAQPYMEANEIAEEDLIPKQEVPRQRMPEDQMSQGEEGVGPDQEMPMNMPNGEPVAMPEEMPEASPEQMMEAPMAMYGMSMPYAQYGDIPLADYGMTMGGFEFPYHPDEMAYGGLVKYQKAGQTLSGRALTGEELKKAAAEREARKVKAIEQGYEDIGGGKFAKGTIEETAGEKKKLNVAQGTGKKQTKAEQDAYLNGVCQRMKTGDLKNYKASELVGKYFSGAFLSRMQACETMTGEKKQNVDVIQKEEETTPEVTTTTQPGKKCQCPDPMDNTKWIDVKCPEDGSEPECGGEEEAVTEEAVGVTPPASAPKWWLQDTINTMGAFGDVMGVKKYMPWEGRVDLEEPRPTFLDPTRELAAQSEQANIASEAAAQFAGPQALNARLAAIQGQGATQAADTLSRINNQNVNIANQFEANQVGVRNQEQLMNQQMANRVFDKNVIANQQFENAKRQGRANLRESYNTALTNRAKTDALNQMYPNYQVDPESGGLVRYTPTEKEADAGAKEIEAREFVDSISGYSPEMQKLLFQQKYGKRYGGQLFEHGGFVYSTFPMILL